MTKSIFLTLGLLFGGIAAFGQSFVGSNPVLPKVKNGAAAWADFDLDGLPDLFLSGEDSAGLARSYLLRNVLGSFQIAFNHTIPGLIAGDAVWADFDGDNDPDLFVTGKDSAGNARSLLARNDLGVFTTINLPLVPGLFGSRICAADLDGDGDQDLFMSGFNPQLGFQGLIARNDGGNAFSVQQDSIYMTRDWPAVACGDFNEDGWVDLAFSDISPFVDQGPRTVVLRNQGGLQFVPQAHFIPGLAQASLQFADDNGDGDLDLLCSGIGVAALTECFRFSTGQFQPENQGLKALGMGNALWVDLNQDGLLDIVSVGYDGGALVETRVYLGTGSGYQLQQGPIGLPKIYNGRLTQADWNGDGFPDVLIQGETAIGFPVTRIATWGNGSQTLNF